MKRLFNSLTLLLVTALLFITGCDTNTEDVEAEHQHTFTYDWSFSEEEHWHSETCGHEEEQGRSTHKFQQDVCTVCGYQRKKVFVTEITLDKTQLELTVGEQAELTATLLPDNADDKTITWESSDEKIATVEDGKINALSIGSVTVVATAGKANAECNVKVNAPDTRAPITFLTFQTEGYTARGTVSNEVKEFSFENEVRAINDYCVFQDEECTKALEKTVVLEEGENKFYLSTQKQGDTFLYCVTVKRLRIFTVTVLCEGERTQINAEEGSAITAPKLAEKEGYKIKFLLDGEEAVFPYCVEGDTEITAIYEANNYVVTLNAKGGECTHSETEVWYDSAYEIAVPTREGHAFEGWYLEEEQLTDKDGKSISEWKFSEGKELTAKWTKEEYTLRLSVNGEGGDVSGADKYPYESEVTVVAECKEGYMFYGWYLDGELLSEDETYSFFMPAENLTVTAEFGTDKRLANFKYTMTEEGCFIESVIDKQAEIIELPDYVTGIGVAAFANCTKVKTISIPEGVTKIEARTFMGCTLLTQVTLLDEITEIGERAFYGCSDLARIQLPPKLKIIAQETFSDCSRLTEIVLPEGLERIEYGAFFMCDGLQELTIPASVNYIEDLAFGMCSHLVHIIMKETSGWVIRDSWGEFVQNVSETALSNATIAASYLTTDSVDGGFADYVWKRTEKET